MAKENDKEQWVESFVVYAISYEGRKRLYKVDTQLNFFVHGIFKFMISLFVEVLWNKVDLTWLWLGETKGYQLQRLWEWKNKNKKKQRSFFSKHKT